MESALCGLCGSDIIIITTRWWDDCGSLPIVAIVIEWTVKPRVTLRPISNNGARCLGEEKSDTDQASPRGYGEYPEDPTPAGGSCQGAANDWTNGSGKIGTGIVMSLSADVS
jgi:hypothetical protein